ncbi:MAG TPA: glycosyltransferase [Chryseolinea sp.]
MKRFAAFIMTYERPQEVLRMIAKLFDQSYPPEKILVVDNSASVHTQEAIGVLNDPRIEYLRTGYNAGPAGAAGIGLKKLAADGFSWIFWGDDNDPPKLNDDFRRLLALADEHKPGIIGAVGHHFNRRTGTIVRLPSSQLKGLLDVDTVAGGDCMIINAEAVKMGIVPDEKLFFGFEEFDFCYRVKRAGFRILVDGDLFYEYRRVTGNLDKKRPLIAMKSNETALKREYYSKRNLIYIFRKNGMVLPLMVLLAKSMLRGLFGFRYGLSFGIKNLRFLVLSMTDGSLSRMGKTLDLR